MLDEKIVLGLDENIVLRSINDKFWALDTRFGTQYKLNRTSFDILSDLDGKKNLSEIVDNVSKLYNVAFDVFLTDAQVLLTDAFEKKIVKEV